MKEITKNTIDNLVLINPILSRNINKDELKIILDAFFEKKFKKLQFNDNSLYHIPDERSIGLLVYDEYFTIQSVNNNNILIKDVNSLYSLSINIEDNNSYSIVEVDSKNELVKNYYVSFEAHKLPQVIYYKNSFSVEDNEYYHNIISIDDARTTEYIVKYERYDINNQLDYRTLLSYDNKDDIHKILLMHADLDIYNYLYTRKK